MPPFFLFKLLISVWLILGVRAVYLKDVKEKQMPQPILPDERGTLSNWKGRHNRDTPKSQAE